VESTQNASKVNAAVEAFNETLYGGDYEQVMTMNQFDDFLIEMQHNG
jgi:hypothetical protein